MIIDAFNNDQIDVTNGPVHFISLTAIEPDMSTGRRCKIRYNNKDYLITQNNLQNRAILDCIQQWERVTILPAYAAKGYWRISRGGLPVVGILVKYCETW